MLFNTWQSVCTTWCVRSNVWMLKEETLFDAQQTITEKINLVVGGSWQGNGWNTFSWSFSFSFPFDLLCFAGFVKQDLFVTRVQFLKSALFSSIALWFLQLFPCISVSLHRLADYHFIAMLAAHGVARLQGFKKIVLSFVFCLLSFLSFVCCILFHSLGFLPVSHSEWPSSVSVQPALVFGGHPDWLDRYCVKKSLWLHPAVPS